MNDRAFRTFAYFTLGLQIIAFAMAVGFAACIGVLVYAALFY
jgi:hypothetical protein